MKTIALYAALDLHSSHSVLGSIDQEGKSQGQIRFATEADLLREQVGALRKKARSLSLTVEAGAMTRWAVGIVRPLVDRLIVCEPRHNRLINSNPNKCDELDVDGMCLLLRLNKLKEVWMADLAAPAPFRSEQVFPNHRRSGKKSRPARVTELSTTEVDQGGIGKRSERLPAKCDWLR
jgi:hypothetical protein